MYDLFSTDVPDISVYEHQMDVIDRTRQSMAEGNRRVIVRAPTGFGKTRLSAWIVAESVRKGKRALFMVYGKDLVRQAHASYLALGIPAATLMANTRNANGEVYDRSRPVQVASISTLTSRLDRLDWLEPDLIITDECRESIVPGYQAVRRRWPQAFEIGLDATPARADGKGLGQVYHDIIHGPEYEWLIERGFLVRPRYFSVPESDSTLLKKNDNGEFTEDSSAAAFEKVVLIGGVVRHWLTYCEGRPTVVFASSVGHSQAVCAQFNEAGVPAFHVDANTDAQTRQAAYDAVAKGDLTVLCNYGVLHRGFDCPPISCVVLEREVNHISSYIQMIGRGLRPWPGKSDCLVLDLGENVYRHRCFVKDPVEWSLDESVSMSEARKEFFEREPKPITCRACRHVYTRAAACPNCGHKPSAEQLKEAEPEKRKAEIAEVDPSVGLRATMDEKRRWYQELEAIRLERGYTRGWESYRFRERFGVLPTTHIKHLPPAQPSDEVRRWVRSRDIAWARREKPRARDATA